MIAARLPETGSTIASGAGGCGLAALLVFAGAMLWRRGRAVAEDSLRWAVAGALVVVGPVVGMVMGAEAGPTDLLVALSLTPVVAAVAMAAVADGAEDLAGRLWPGLAAVAGLLLMLPQPSLGDVRMDVVLALSGVLPGVGAAVFCSGGSGKALARLVAGLSGAGLVFGVALVVQVKVRGIAPWFSGWAAVMDGVLAVLGLLTLVRLGTMRWAAQFALVPLVVTVEGLVLLRPGWDWRVMLGLGLLLAASVYLLLPPVEDEGDGSELGLG